MQYSISNLFLTMEIVKMVKTMIPCLHATMDEDKRYHVGATWTNENGLTDRHNIEIRYTRNSEQLAVDQGEPQLDGSWVYKEPNGTQHTISKGRALAYEKLRQKHADEYQEMQHRKQAAGLSEDFIDATLADAT